MAPSGPETFREDIWQPSVLVSLQKYFVEPGQHIRFLKKKSLPQLTNTGWFESTERK